jgi:hypothetical protein
MAVNANTVESYDVSTLRDDLQEALISISPEECPFVQNAGDKSISQSLYEWPVLELAAVDSSNRVIEGDDAPDTDTGTIAGRAQNYAQISDKVVSVSHTDDASDGAGGDHHQFQKQIAIKLRELKRDMETMLLANVVAATGSSGVARQTAGLPAWLKTNTDRGSGGTDPTVSGSGDFDGYPNAAAGAGTGRALTETIFNDVIELIWNEGGEPGMAMCNGARKRKISTFTGNASRYKNAEDRRLVAAIDLYASDFGFDIQIVPNRFMAVATDVYLLTPGYYRVAWLEKTKQKALAETGHSRKRLVWCEYGLQIDNEKAHGVVADCTS